MNQSVVKALRLLAFFDEKNPAWTLKEIAEKAELTKPTAYRLLSSLEQEGFLMKDGEQNYEYKLGLRLLELGHLVANQMDIRNIAKPYMEALGREINEAVHLVIRNDDQATYIEKVESNRAIRLYTKIGRSSPLYIGSGPKLLLAFMEPSEIDRLIDRAPLQSMHTNEMIDREELMAEVNQIQAQGYAISYGEQDEGTVGISFPIYDHRNKVSAALTVSGLSQHFEGQAMNEMKMKTQQTANQMSTALGSQAMVQQ